VNGPIIYRRQLGGLAAASPVHKDKCKGQTLKDKDKDKDKPSTRTKTWTRFITRTITRHRPTTTYKYSI